MLSIFEIVESLRFLTLGIVSDRKLNLVCTLRDRNKKSTDRYDIFLHNN